MFDGKYFEWNSKRVKGIVDFYGHKFFYFKKILDLGCGHADISGVLYRLGADVTAVDSRQDHLKIVTKKFSGIKTVKADLDGTWPFSNKKFDLILDLGLLCHLSSYENHLKTVCASTTHLVLETAVCDSDDPTKCLSVPENKGIYDLSANGAGSRPSAAAVERVLNECGMNFRRIDNAKFNAADYTYDWWPQNDNSSNLGKRRIWFAVKTTSPVQFAYPDSEIVQTPFPLPLITPTGFIPTLKNNGPPLTASPKGPHSRVDVRQYSIYDPTKNKTVTVKSHLPSYATDHNVQFNIKHNATFIADQYVAPITFDISGIVSATSFSTSSWLAKIIPFFPKLKINSDTIISSNKTNQQPTLLLGELGTLRPCSRIFVEEFIGHLPNENDMRALSFATHIFTPSIPNAQYFRKTFPNTKITSIPKIWPTLTSYTKLSLPENYGLVIVRNQNFLDMIIRQWPHNELPLVILGGRGRFPTNTTVLPNYLEYDKIFSTIIGASHIIDLPENNHYMSGILDLAFIAGIPIITSNHWMSIAQPPATFIKSHLVNNKLIPIESEIDKSFKNLIKKEPNTFDMNSYNLQLYANMKIMLEEV